MQKFLGGAIRRVKAESLLQILPDCVRYRSAEFAGLPDQRKRLREPLLGAHMRGNNGDHRGFLLSLVPIPPGPIKQSREDNRAHRPKCPGPTARNYHRRFDVTEAVRSACQGGSWNWAVRHGAFSFLGSRKIWSARPHTADPFASEWHQCPPTGTGAPDPLERALAA